MEIVVVDMVTMTMIKTMKMAVVVVVVAVDECGEWEGEARLTSGHVPSHPTAASSDVTTE